MRLIALLLIISSLSMAANTTYRLDLTMETSCPGDVMTVDAIASNGQPAVDVELRLVLYEPYQGLRALKHTSSSGQTFFELTRNGSYRVYVNTEEYNHEKYYPYEYPELCPPPPPKHMVVAGEINCDSRIMKINVSDNDGPVENVFVNSLYWSSMTGKAGTISLPFEEDDYFLSFSRTGYNDGTVLFENPCYPQSF